ncbi:unnamed protein product [Phytophthora lilii]|uniref:Unnamed protein product n=1 Tax=Phytophthora lilii TaxID=2077276 RepID=A0A9W6TCZ6_9STRA|nr:unnamed protein product [Phytophthora lilii]
MSIYREMVEEERNKRRRHLDMLGDMKEMTVLRSKYPYFRKLMPMLRRFGFMSASATSSDSTDVKDSTARYTSQRGQYTDKRRKILKTVERVLLSESPHLQDGGAGHTSTLRHRVTYGTIRHLDRVSSTPSWGHHIDEELVLRHPVFELSHTFQQKFEEVKLNEEQKCSKDILELKKNKKRALDLRKKKRYGQGCAFRRRKCAARSIRGKTEVGVVAADAALDTSAAPSDALEVENVPESLYVASPRKGDAEASLGLGGGASRFAPFEESYEDMNELRRALKVLSVQRDSPYYMQHSSPQRVEARCPSWRQRKRRSNADGEGAASAVCDFVVSANRHANGRVYVTRAVVDHSPTCTVLHARLAANAQATATGETGSAAEKTRVSGVTASALLETALPFMGQLANFRGGRDAVKPKDVSDIMKEKFGVKPSYMTAWRALSAFRKQRKEEDSASYMKLNGYLQAFAATNAGSLVAFEHLDPSQVTVSSAKPPSRKIFGRAFLCPEPLHGALKNCRGSMLLSVFLVTSAFGGVVFTATAQDAMGDNVPIAIGLAPAETEPDWRFFLQHLRRAFPDLERSVTSLVHNRGDELTRAAHTVFPNCPQSNEVEVFMRNSTQAATATSETSGSPATAGAAGSTLSLDSSMQWMEALCTKAPLMILVGWVSQVARTLFQRYERYGHLSSEYPAEFHSLAAEYEGEASRYDVVRTSESEFEVISHQTGAGRVVNFAKQTCTCGEYDVSRFPCLHVFLAVTHAGMLQTDVIPRIFLMTSLKTLYAGRITPIDIDTVASDGVTIPQPLPRTRGRPRKVQQIQQFGDPKQEKLSCSVCGVKGHNKRTCKRLAAVPVPIARGTNVGEIHPDDVVNGQEDTTFLVSTYGDALAFDNSALGGNGSESHVSDGQSLHMNPGKRRRLTDDNVEDKKTDDDDGEEEETTGVALV